MRWGFARVRFDRRSGFRRASSWEFALQVLLGNRLRALLIACVLAAHAPSAVAQTAPPAAPAAVAAPLAQTDNWFRRQWNALVSAVSGGSERGRVAAPTANPAANPAASPAAAPKTGIAAAGGAGAAPGAPPPAVVTTSQPVAREIVEWDDYTGRFDAVESVEVRSRVAGYLVAVHFKDGQRVKKGDLLATIDPRPFERVLDTANAELAQAQTRVENSMKDVVRGRSLLDRKIIAEKVFDDRDNVKRDAESAVKVAEAKVKTAELDLSFTKIMSPIDGVAGRNLVSAGNYVSAAGAASQSLVTTIVSQDPIHIYFDVSENNTIKYKRLAASPLAAGATVANASAATVSAPQAALPSPSARGKIGSPPTANSPPAPIVDAAGIVEIALSDEVGFPHRGTLDFADNRMDPATGTLRLRALVDNKAGLFSAGMFGRVRVPGSVKAVALLLPDDAIGTDQAAKFVYTVGEDGVGARKVVTLGPVIDGLRVVRTGLTATDWVVTKGIQRVRPGNKVAAKREPIAVAASGAATAASTPR
jgi:RND family efflux transporter MFP subunit